MSLLSSLYTGATGLDANSKELSVVGDNIANANTVGFKRARAAFEDAMSTALVGGTGHVGMGTRLQVVQRLLAQGSLLNTGVATDLALEGQGYFVVAGQHGGVDGTFYTRAGQFTVDREGYLVTLSGLRVQGNAANAMGQLGGGTNDLRVGDASFPPVPTANIMLKANLDGDARVFDPAVDPPWDPAQPTATSNTSSSVVAYDSLGHRHTLDVYYRHTGPGTWDWYALTDGAGVVGGTPGVPSEVAGGSLTFDDQGRLVDSTQGSNFNPTGALAPQALTFDFGDALAFGGTGQGGLTQYASPSITTYVGQDGAAPGSLASVDVDSHGNLMGTFTNGQTRLLGQLAVADFSAPDRLRPLGGNLLAATPSAGEPVVGGGGDGGRASIIAGALEQSNVDLASEFIRMMASQRGFQANSKTLTTADQLLQELINLKR
jgi:flagellar hook protein FlgE